MKLSDEVKKAVGISQSLAREYKNQSFGAAHLMLALLNNDLGLSSWIAALGKDIPFMREWAEIRLEDYPKSSVLSDQVPADAPAVKVLELAELISIQLHEDEISTVSLFCALLKPGLGFSQDQLKSFITSEKEILSAAMDDSQLREVVSGPAAPGSQDANRPVPKASGALLKYCIDKTELARAGKLDPVIGRDKELRMMIEVLGRRTKPNVIIVGEPGVGKSALIEGFAQAIQNKSVPGFLQNASLFELDTGALVAGASYKGEVEERIKSILKEIKACEKAILFIDEIHVLLDPKGSIGSGVTNLLKPELARGDLTVIGATTSEEFRKFIEPDQAFARRFELIKVEEPDIITAARMLGNTLRLYEDHHGLKVDEDAVMEAVLLAKRYVKERRLPDAAVDLLDRTMAAIKMMTETSTREIEAMRERFDRDFSFPTGSDPESEESLSRELAEINWSLKELKDKISPILFSQLDEEADLQDADLETPAALKRHLDRSLNHLKTYAIEKRDRVSKSDLAALVSYKTGIPLGKIQSREREKLLSVEDVLKKRVLGQNHAVKAVSEAILESRSGLVKAGQPVGSFFFLGPTGTGKTELAKSLADFLFNDESFLIRFDMSEFKEEHSAALLLGAPPGYVGYEEGGVLVNKIREKPYSVVLFDEIEKAHPSVFDIFLQIMDEGKLHDRLGKEGDFSNAIVLFTSNIGSSFIAEKFANQTIPSSADLLEVMAGHFRPEFLARVTELIPFAPITEENAVQIFNIHLRSLTDPLHKQGISLEISPEACRLFALSGFSPTYGARQIKGVIRNQLRRPVSRMIISGQLIKGSILRISTSRDDIEKFKWEVS